VKFVSICQENLSQNGFVWEIFNSPEFIKSSELLADFAFDLWSSASLSLFKRDPSLLKMSQIENPNQA